MEPWTGEFKMLNPREIVVDHKYQRPEKPSLINHIASSFDWRTFGVVQCTRRDNTMHYCLDGQQRLRGALTLPKPPQLVPAIVHVVASVEEEARIFTEMNEHRKALASLEKFKGHVAAKTAHYVRINAAVEKVGFTIGESTNDARTIGAVAGLLDIYNQAGEEGLVHVLTAIRDAWPDDKYATSTYILKALGDIVAQSNGELNRAKLTAALSRTMPAKILRKAEETKLDYGGSKRVNVRRAFKALARI